MLIHLLVNRLRRKFGFGQQNELSGVKGLVFCTAAKLAGELAEQLGSFLGLQKVFAGAQTVVVGVEYKSNLEQDAGTGGVDELSLVVVGFNVDAKLLARSRHDFLVFQRATCTPPTLGDRMLDIVEVIDQNQVGQQQIAGMEDLFAHYFPIYGQAFAYYLLADRYLR